MLTKKVESTVDQTVHINKMLTTDSFVTPTTCGLQAKIGMFLEVSDEFVDYLPDKGIIREKTREQSIEDIVGADGFSVAKMKYLYTAMVNGLTPIVQAKDIIVDFLNWEDPFKTFFYSLLISLFVLNPRYSIIIAFVILFFFDRPILFSLINRANTAEQKESWKQINRKNMKFVKALLRSHTISYDYYARIFKDQDKTLLIRGFLQVKYFAPYIIPILFIFRLRWLLLLGYWGLLFNNTRIGNVTFLSAISKAHKLYNRVLGIKCPLCTSSSQVQPQTSLKPARKDSNGIGKGSPLNSDASTEATTRFSFSDVSSMKAASKEIKEKVFILYENQRWWLGQGWQSELLPGERPSWSDESGKNEVDMQKPELPSENWSWETDWNFVVSNKTDKDGWEYASRFGKFDDPDRKESMINLVRRRKWLRKCVGYDESSPLKSPILPGELNMSSSLKSL